jgi:hypothetical protein
MAELLKTEGYLFDKLLWNYIKSFVLAHQCIEWCCNNPGTILAGTSWTGYQTEYHYRCCSCFSKLMFDTREEYKRTLYCRVRSEVSTRVIGIAELKRRIKSLSDKNIVRLLNVPQTIRNMRPLKNTLSHVFLYKIPKEKEDAKTAALLLGCC